MEILPKQIKINDLERKDTISKIYRANMDLDEILIFNPNKCLHRAGIPVQGNERTQLMLQLNVSSNWTFNCDIAYRQNLENLNFHYFLYFCSKERQY